jgi:hypothetical protein
LSLRISLSRRKCPRRCPIPQALFKAYAYPQISPKTTARKDKSRLVLGILPTRRICPRRCPNPAKFACWGIRHPANYALKRARTSRDLSLRISFSRKICPRRCPIPQAPFRAYAHPQISPKTTARTDKSRLVLGILPTRKICPRSMPQSRKICLLGHSPPRILCPKTGKDKSRLVPSDILFPENMPPSKSIQQSSPKTPPRQSC